MLLASTINVIFTLVIRFALRFDKKSSVNILRRFKKPNSDTKEDS